MTRVQRLAPWTVRLLILGAVAFWWGGYVIPQLLRVAYLDFLPLNAIPDHLQADADVEGSVANAVSAAAFATVALLAYVNAAVNLRSSGGWIPLAGWTVLGMTATGLAVEEVAEFKALTLIPAARAVYHSSLWPLLVSPLLVAFAGGMWLFARKGLSVPEARIPLVLGIAAWLFALVHEASETVLFSGQKELGRLFEETLEFSGTLLLGLSAGLALLGRGAFRGRWRRRLTHSVVAVVIIGGLSLAFVVRVPLVDARAYGSIGVFQVDLPAKWSLVQGMRMPGAAIRHLRVKAALGSPADGRTRAVAWRVLREESGTILREGFVDVWAVSHLPWVEIDLLQPLVEPEGTRLSLQLTADFELNAGDSGFWHQLRVGGLRGDRYPDGRLWINGELTWPDQDLQFVAYGSPEPTWSKLQSLWQLATAHWRWPLLAANLAAAATLITLAPLALVSAALSARFPRESVASETRQLRRGGG